MMIRARIRGTFSWLWIGGMGQFEQMPRVIRGAWRNITTDLTINSTQPLIPTIPRYKSEAYFEKLEVLPIVHVHATPNNTICTITDNKGKVLGWASAGSVGFKKARRGTGFAAQVVGVATAKKSIGFGINRVNIKVKGFTQGRAGVLQGLSKGGLQIAAITDCTPISWGGCRPRKVRRV